ncbi:transcriptional regulator [Corynebacterium aquatimens]|uniref:transcriptional regulator n=1 Tax=Corynebacterium TaxID=1716 RepID=UPI001F4171D2|nr:MULTISPECIES: transcriptional regulator [Corynebacterium]QYH19324.1 transcriptional regulator [Corynebacterium aquatimens]UIZ91780.1 transcriptional regulator [Corynebacterium sp. CNCTC7651]
MSAHNDGAPGGNSDGFDAVIHPLGRLKICAALFHSGATETAASRQEMRFTALKDATGLSDSALSKQLSALEEHGYITRFREYGSSRGKDTVWVTLTAAGVRAFEGHVAALQQIAEG